MTSSAPARPSGAPAPAGGEQREQPERATLLLYEPVLKPYGAKRGAQKGEVKFQFNPAEVRVGKASAWRRSEAKSAKSAGALEFLGVQPATLSVTMFLDASGTHDGSVVAAVEQLLGCCAPTPSSRDQKKPFPNLVVFQWGQITSFPAVVTSVDARYTLFTRKGVPIRAICAIEMEEVGEEQEKTNPTSGGLAVRRVHTMVDGDTLASVAYAEYGSAEFWRPLAAYNGIDDPMILSRGQDLLLPAVQEFVAQEMP